MKKTKKRTPSGVITWVEGKKEEMILGRPLGGWLSQAGGRGAKFRANPFPKEERKRTFFLNARST